MPDHVTPNQTAAQSSSDQFRFDAHAPQEQDLLILLWYSILERKRVVAISAFLFGLVAVGVALWLPPIYRAEVMMVTASEDRSMGSLAALSNQFGGLAALAGMDIGEESTAQQQAVAILRSREFTVRFMTDEHLLPVLFADKWDAEKSQWISAAQNRHPTYWDAYKKFDEKIREVKRNKKTGLITLAIEWTDPDVAAHWANELVRRVNATIQRQTIEEARRSIEYLQAQLQKTTVLEVQQAIYRLIEAQVKKIMLAEVREEYAFKIIDPAVVPEEKVRPKRALIVLLGIFGGGIVGLFTAAVLGLRTRQRALSKLPAMPARDG